MKTSIKLLALLLAIFMLGSCLIACANDTEQPNDDEQGKNPPTDNPGDPGDGIIKPDIPETYDWGKKDVSFLYWSVAGWESTVRYCRDIDSDKVTGEPIPDTVYYRNIDIQEAYNVNITLEIQAHNVITQTIINNNMSGDSTYLVTVPRAVEIGPLVVDGEFHNLYEVNHIDLEKPWWDQDSINQLTTMGTLNMIATALMVNDKDATAALAFNKQAILDYELDDPYEYVHDGAWTYEAAAEFADKANSDLDGDDKMGKDDFWGFLGKNDVMTSLFHGSGGLFVTKDEDDMFILNFGSDEIHIEATQDLMDEIMDADFFFNHHIENVQDDEYTQMFTGGFGLFFWMRLDEVTNMRGSDTDFGILPIPKYTEDQEKHYSTVSQHTTGLLTIPLSTVNDDLDMVGMILEAMSAHSYYDLQDEYIEVSLKGKYSRDDQSEEMLDIILNSRVFDPGCIYGFGGFADNYQSLYAAGGNVSSFLASYEDKTITAIEEFYEKLGY